MLKEQPEATLFLRRVVDGALTSPLLLVGPDGVGRRFSVLQTIKEILQPHGSFHAIQVDSGSHPDVLLVSVPSGKNDIGVDLIRDAVAYVESFPVSSPVRFVIIDGADTMTVPASNALLKTLEEPPASARFFLLAENLGSVLPTIRSRCGLVRYQRLSVDFIAGKISEHTEDVTKALVYARLSNGSLGRAVQYLGAGKLGVRDQMLELLEKSLTGNVADTFQAVDEVKDIDLGILFLGSLLQDLVTLGTVAPINADVQHRLEKVGLRLKVRLPLLVSGYSGLLGRVSVNKATHLKSWLLGAHGS
jgi:DNA polymerase-3 subunit delta'